MIVDLLERSLHKSGLGVNMTSFIGVFLFSVFSFSKTMVPVTLEQFQPQGSWSWAFSEFDPKLQAWNAPYLFEKYTVTKVEGTLVTIEMSSSSSYPVETPPHHKFIADVQKCLTANSDYKTKKPWSVKFYTKSFGPEWELVSSAHKPLVFTEKFNCISTIDDSIILESVYVEQGPLAGIAASKVFDVNYKFELIAQ